MSKGVKIADKYKRIKHLSDDKQDTSIISS